ncbi:MAG: diaminopimelate decarboxylase family protein [Kofleriaceae bacterium]
MSTLDFANPDDCLGAKNGMLHIDGIAADALVERFGSPLFVVSEQQLRRNVARFQRAFGAGWTAGSVKVMPAVKANWNLAVQRVLASAGCGADIYSAGELEIALRAGMPPASISVNGVPKTAAQIRRTVEVGARLTVDSMEDVRILGELSPTTKAKVRLRLRPPVSDFIRSSDFVAEGWLPTDLVALAYKGGLSFDEAVIAGRQLMAMPHVELVGVHQHHGRHHRTTAWWRAQMLAYVRELGRLVKALPGFRPTEMDIGGGFAIPRDPHNAATDRAAPFLFTALHGVSRALAPLGPRVRYGVLDRLSRLIRGAPNKIPAPSIEDYARVVTATLLEELPRNGIDPRGIELQLEPGRSIHGNAGVHLSTVRSLKRQTAPIAWNHVTVDTSEFFLTGGRFEHHMHAHLVANKVGAPDRMVADVTGASCYADRLLGAVTLPDVAVGDIFAFLDTGAYQESSCSNFNAMPRPAMVLVNGTDAHVIKRAETLDDVLARDRVPAHLDARAPDALPAHATTPPAPRPLHARPQ